MATVPFHSCRWYQCRQCCKKKLHALKNQEEQSKHLILKTILGNDLQANEYSSGESDEDDNFALKSEEQQIQRIAELWCQTIAKAKGAGKVINRFGDLNRVIYYHGSTKKLEELELLERMKPHPVILMPDSKFLGKCLPCLKLHSCLEPHHDGALDLLCNLRSI